MMGGGAYTQFVSNLILPFYAPVLCIHSLSTIWAGRDGQLSLWQSNIVCELGVVVVKLNKNVTRCLRQQYNKIIIVLKANKHSGLKSDRKQRSAMYSFFNTHKHS